MNFIKIVTEMMQLYINNVSEFNISLGNKMFELLIEMLQGPCKENQLEVCKENLLEVIEDLFILLTSRSKRSNIDINEEEKSNMILNITTFLNALLETTHD